MSLFLPACCFSRTDKAGSEVKMKKGGHDSKKKKGLTSDTAAKIILQLGT